MPYEIRSVKGGYKVGHKGKSKTYSKKPQTLAKAKAQLRAMYANANPVNESQMSTNPATSHMQRFAESLGQEITRQRIREGRVGRLAGVAVTGSPVANSLRHGIKAGVNAGKALGQAATLHPIKAIGSAAKAVGHTIATNPIASSVETGVKAVKAIRKPRI